MTYGAAILILSALIHATWNALIKKMEDKSTGLFFVAIFATLTSLLIAPFTGGFTIGSTKAFWGALIAGFFEAGYLVALTHAFEKAPMGIAYAIMRGGAMLIVWFVSAAYLGEPVTWVAIVSVISVLIGLFIVPPRHPNAKISLALGWAVVAAVCIAGYHIFYGVALQEGSSQVTVFLISIVVSVPILGMRNNFHAFKTAKKVLQAQPVIVIGCGVMSAASFILFLYGLTITQAGAAITLRNTSVAFAQILALMMGERLNGLQWFGILLITAGAMALGL